MRRFSGRLSTCAEISASMRCLGLWSDCVRSIPAVADDANSADQQRVAAIEAKLDELNEALSQTEKMLEKSRAEIQSLHSQLDTLRAQTAAPPPEATAAEAAGCRSRPAAADELECPARATGRDAGGDQTTRSNQGRNLFKIPFAAERAYPVQRVFQRRRRGQHGSSHIRASPFSRGIPWQLRRDPAADTAHAGCYGSQNCGQPAVPRK